MTTTKRGDDTDRPISDAELHATISSGLGAVLEIGDRVAVQCHSGTKLEGIVEDVNLAGVVVRTIDVEAKTERVFFVTFAGIEYAEIFEDDEDDEGDRADVEPAGEEPPRSSDITPITSAARGAA